MYFREVYEVCKRELGFVDNFHLKFRNIFMESTGDGLDLMKYGVEFEDFYSHVYNEFYGISYFSESLMTLEQYIYDSKKRSKFEMLRVLSDLRKEMQCVILLYETTVNQNISNVGIRIKMPGIDNITELKRHIDGLEFVFTKCPFFQSKEESLKLQAVDNGSIWLIFGIVGGSVAIGSVLLNNIAAFIDKCFVIKSHKLTCDMQEQAIRNMVIDQKEKDELLENINKVYKITVKNAIKELETSTGCKINDGDEMGRTEQSFEKMIKLLELGLQIYSSLNAPEEVKALFAPLEMRYLEIGEILGRIEEKGTE